MFPIESFRSTISMLDCVTSTVLVMVPRARILTADSRPSSAMDAASVDDIVERLNGPRKPLDSVGDSWLGSPPVVRT